MPLAMLLLTLLIANADAHYNVLVYGPTDSAASTSLGSHAIVTVWDSTQWAAAVTSDFEAYFLALYYSSLC